MSTKEIIDKILNPRPEYADELLERLGLARPPTEEEVLKTVEKEFLEPKLPDTINWQQQVYPQLSSLVLY
jgi:hypothetical protein